MRAKCRYGSAHVNDFIKEEIKNSGKGMTPDAASPFSGVLVMPKYENPAKKESELFCRILCAIGTDYFLLLMERLPKAEWTAGRITRTTARTIIRSTKSVRACTTQTDSVRFMPRL